MSFLIGTLSNIIANVVFWLLLGIVFWAVTKASRRRFVRFFELRTNDRVDVWLSNLWSSRTSRRPIGYNISMHELRAAQSINGLFASSSMRLPELVRGLVDTLWLPGRIRCTVEVSPPILGDLPEMTNSIIIGASRRNSIRQRLIELGLVHAMLIHETEEGAGLPTDEVHSIFIKHTSGELQSVDSPLNLGIIEKTHLPDSGASLIFCAGARADSTWGAAEYLVRHWRKLEREFSTDPFVICLGFPKLDLYPEEYIEPKSVTSIRI